MAEDSGKEKRQTVIRFQISHTSNATETAMITADFDVGSALDNQKVTKATIPSIRRVAKEHFRSLDGRALSEE